VVGQRAVVAVSGPAPTRAPSLRPSGRGLDASRSRRRLP